MKTACAFLVICLAAGGSSVRAGEAEKDRAEAALNSAMEKYFATTQEDLKSDPNYPNLKVIFTAWEVLPDASLLTPFRAEVKYQFEYDDPSHKGERLTHPFLMKCYWSGTRWDIDPHGHRDRKNLTDLSPKESRMLFPNI